MESKDTDPCDFDRILPEDLDLATVRILIKRSFSTQELWRFVRDLEYFQPVCDQVDANASLDEITDSLVEFSSRRDLFSELLSCIRKFNPRQYERHRNQLLMPPEEKEAESVSHQVISEDAAQVHPAPRRGSYEELQEAYEKSLREQISVRLQTTYEETLNSLAWAIETDRCVLFLGPACSEAANLRHELGLAPPGAPTRKTLVCKLAEELHDEGFLGLVERICGECPDCRHCILPEVASEYWRMYGRKKLKDFVSVLLRAGQPREFHHQLWNLPFSAIYTVNYDELVDRSREGTEWGIVTNDDVFATVSVRIDEGKIPFYKLFGSMDAKEVVITVDDRIQLRLAKQDSAIWRRLKTDLQGRSFLFIGYGLGDQEVLETVFSVHAEGYALPPSYAVIDKPLPLTARELGKYGIQIIHKNTDEFFRDLVRTFRQVKEQISAPSSQPSLEHRYPSVWRAFEPVVEEQTFSGLCLYGRSNEQDDKPFVEGQLHVIPKEMHEECKRRQRQGKRILCASVDLVQLGTNATVDPWRTVKLLQDLARQLDDERSVVGLPSLDLAGNLAKSCRDSWRREAEARVHQYWYQQFGEKQYTDVRDAVDNPSTEQQKKNRWIRERRLTSQVQDWLSWELSAALDGYRLIVFFTDFHLIETDPDWFIRVSQNFLSPLCDHNVGLIITRRLAKRLLVDRVFSSYWQRRFTQFNLGDYV